ncbi:type-F conjugative transfer system mating-pair stabilization protein TraN [Vibrio europaeus]|uniref:type-F conjugative transfer system mating-pair stabilization protein TraN n=1 Tax=Vibrio europaeus TaxID=300876 RepID=UPI00233EB90D|nr:type-F conjugative transfer system mating-pair stabilization protein TraN [Vibrio europaeus]MDC5721965.1 type-F conjugative transfer system mating-pair stabilization protein TraN [Vibrio europaeus]
MNKVLILAFVLLTVNVMANQKQPFNESANWAKQTAKNMLEPNQIPLDVNDYCQDATCRAKVINPDETSLNDGNMETKAAQAFAASDLAQGIRKNTNKKRPDFRHDESLRYALLGQENAFEISHGQSNKYVNCERDTQCLFDDVEKTCHAPTHTPVPCYKTPRFTPEIIAPSYQCDAGQLTGHRCLRYRNECRYSSRDRWIVSHQCQSATRNYGLWNGNMVRAPFFKGRLRTTRSTPCERGGATASFTSYDICRQVAYYTPGTPVCPAGYGLSGNQCVKNHVDWRVECTLIKACQPLSQRCIEGAASRMINGVATYLPCWKYEVRHECDLPDNCGQYAECKEDKRECSLKQNGVCIEEKVTHTCTKKTCRTMTLNCGEQSFCLDGECYDPLPTLNRHFDQSAAALAALGEAAKGLGDPPNIFSGEPMQCSKKAASIANCCRDSGWGTDAGLVTCNEEEKALIRAKDKGLTLYVGEYCAEKILGACLRKKRSYCAYDSRLGKIIQEQGAINQLGKTLGSAESPTCPALTPEELGQINFDRIDFSEFYPELHSRIHLPDPNVIKQRIQNSLSGEAN